MANKAFLRDNKEMKILWPLFFIFITSCQGPQKKQREFDAIQIGMGKSDVIAIAGAPYWSDRQQGQDRWIYYLTPDDAQSERVVYFENGQVVSKGLRRKPTLSAEEMDDLKTRQKVYVHKPRYSDDELRKILKEEVNKSKKNRKENFEKL